MKKSILFTLVLIFGTIALHAKPIDRSLAQTAAQQFATKQLAIERAMPELVYTGQNETFYVFNLDANSFVIIAGDDAHRPVIGYSNESSFDASNIPPALAYYLDGVAECMLRLHNATVTPDVEFGASARATHLTPRWSRHRLFLHDQMEPGLPI